MRYIFILLTILFVYSCQQDTKTVLIKFNIDLPSVDNPEDEENLTILTPVDFDRLEKSQIIIEALPFVEYSDNLKFNIADNDCISLDKEKKTLTIGCSLKMDIYNNSQISTYIKDNKGIYLAARNYINIEEGREEETQELSLKFRKIIKFSIPDMKNLSIVGYTPFDEAIKGGKRKMFERNAKEMKKKENSFYFPVSIRPLTFSNRFNIFFEIKKDNKKGIVLPFKILTAKQNQATEITDDQDHNREISQEANCFNSEGVSDCKRIEECASSGDTNDSDTESLNQDCFGNQIGTSLMNISKQDIYPLRLKLYENDIKTPRVSSMIITNKQIQNERRGLMGIDEYTNLGSFFLTGYNFNNILNGKRLLKGEIKISYGKMTLFENVYLSYKGALTLYPLKNEKGIVGWVLQNRFPFYHLCGSYERGIRECTPYPKEPTFLQQEPESITFTRRDENGKEEEPIILYTKEMK